MPFEAVKVADEFLEVKISPTTSQREKKTTRGLPA